ncbi:putative virion structural protein [Erwinia phage vB_EamM_Phobos]|uniref:putative virion structural protein n=1 Tax=Erwinia phage vB_EamM_Phobos TaxID=1883377 RepID=UPI00081CB480|nr:putative virion structural protein [Erwinia phage vB_EamM_Phobos]ANZ50269.1 putative virion structural protein [Erwinia phage vB_EamM_Phobos]
MQRYNIFVGQCIDLADSLIIKSEAIADAMNMPLVEAGILVPTDKTQWRYYQHLAGQRFNTDSPVMITSLDTQEVMELTVSNLARHKKTSNVYRANPDYITALISEYPDMVVYIRGVFNPILMGDAIGAADCTVLYYSQKLVEEQEQSIISDLQTWIQAAHVRWMAEGWKVHNDAFVAAFYSQLFPAIPGKIQDLRLARCHTQEVHSFHVEEFLASHQRLNEFLPYLTAKQKFTLYRNIRYWERNTGKEDIFQWLIDVFLTGWNMPVASYEVGQQIHDPVDDNSLRPLPVGYKNPLNFDEMQGGRDLQLVTTTEIISKEYGLATENPLYQEEMLDDLNERLSLTQYPDQPTKLIEITAIDPEAVERDQLDMTLFNELLHLACLGRYNIQHEIINPTNGDTMRMATKELIALFLYAAYQGYSGIELEHIPTMNCQGVLIKRWVTVDELLAFLPESYPDRWLPTVNYYVDTHTEIYSNLLSADEFYTAATGILAMKRNRWKYTQNRRRDTDTIAGDLLYQYYYRSYKCDLELGFADYKEFFAKFAMDYEIISSESWADIAVDAFNILTAYETNSSVTQSEIQRAMVKLLTMLSSYTIHFATRMASDSFIVTDPLVIKPDETMTSAALGEIIIQEVIEPIDTKIKARGSMELQPTMPEIVETVIPQNFLFWFNLRPRVEVQVHSSLDVVIDMPLIEAEVTDITRVPWDGVTLEERVVVRNNGPYNTP